MIGPQLVGSKFRSIFPLGGSCEESLRSRWRAGHKTWLPLNYPSLVGLNFKLVGFFGVFFFTMCEKYIFFNYIGSVFFKCCYYFSIVIFAFLIHLFSGLLTQFYVVIVFFFVHFLFGMFDTNYYFLNNTSVSTVFTIWVLEGLTQCQIFFALSIGSLHKCQTLKNRAGIGPIPMPGIGPNLLYFYDFYPSFHLNTLTIFFLNVFICLFIWCSRGFYRESVIWDAGEFKSLQSQFRDWQQIESKSSCQGSKVSLPHMVLVIPRLPRRPGGGWLMRLFLSR